MKGKYFIEVWNEDTHELILQSKMFETPEAAEKWYDEDIVTTNECAIAIMQEVQLSECKGDTDIKRIKLLHCVKGGE